MKRTLRPLEKASKNALPEAVIGYVSVKGRKSLLQRAARRIPETTKTFHAPAAQRRKVARQLEKMGLHIVAESPLGFAVAGPPDAFEELTGAKLHPRERRLRGERRRARYVTHLDIRGRDQPRELGVGRARSPRLGIDAVILDRPRRLHAVSSVPPAVSGFYLDVPDGVAAKLNAAGAHQNGFIGQGVRIAMPDSGMFPHPYYAAHGFPVLTPSCVIPNLAGDEDPTGHGTGECANIFAVAPDCEVQPIRCSNENGALVGGLAGIVAAKSAGAQIISISFGGTLQFPPTPQPTAESLALSLELQDAVERGIVVVAAAGDGQFAMEPQAPGVISAGGVFVDQQGRRQASDIASAFESPWFPGVSVPIVCGLCGMFPDFYLMLPVPPASEMDFSQAGFPGEPNDGTMDDDGWARFSGTSACAPQIAGAAAVLLSAKPNLTPAEVAQSLSQTARDVRRGRSSPIFDQPAEVGHDVATGFGLIDVSAALAFAQQNFQ
jgi:subtilase family protein